MLSSNARWILLPLLWFTQKLQLSSLMCYDANTDPNIQLTVNCSSDPVQIYWSSGNDLSVEWILLQYSCDGAQKMTFANTLFGPVQSSGHYEVRSPGGHECCYSGCVEVEFDGKKQFNSVTCTRTAGVAPSTDVGMIMATTSTDPFTSQIVATSSSVSSPTSATSSRSPATSSRSPATLSPLTVTPPLLASTANQTTTKEIQGTLLVIISVPVILIFMISTIIFTTLLYAFKREHSSMRRRAVYTGKYFTSPYNTDNIICDESVLPSAVMLTTRSNSTSSVYTILDTFIVPGPGHHFHLKKLEEGLAPIENEHKLTCDDPSHHHQLQSQCSEANCLQGVSGPSTKASTDDSECVSESGNSCGRAVFNNHLRDEVMPCEDEISTVGSCCSLEDEGRTCDQTGQWYIVDKGTEKCQLVQSCWDEDTKYVNCNCENCSFFSSGGKIHQDEREESDISTHSRDTRNRGSEVSKSQHKVIVSTTDEHKMDKDNGHSSLDSSSYDSSTGMAVMTEDSGFNSTDGLRYHIV